MAQHLFAHGARPMRLRLPRPVWLGLGAVALALVATTLAGAVAPKPAACQGVCQCWYCPRYHWIDGRPVCDSPCDHGCVGACAYNDQQPHLPPTCSQVPGQGGCGPVCSCRAGDCGGAPVPTENPPTPVVTPEPTPPPDCPALGKVREWTEIIPPKLTFAGYKPERPVVVEQDPDKQGFRLQMTGKGGRYEHKTQQLEKVCDDQPPPAAGSACQVWHWACPIRCPECYDDPFAAVQVRMRLADPTLAWLQGELAQRYTGVQPKEGLPRTWQLPGVRNRMTLDLWWRYAPGQPDVLSNGPLDPGVHGGKIVGWTTGTAKSPPQVVEAPFSVPVYLLDTTIAK